VALKFFARAVNTISKRFNGISGRYGGEEIVVAFPRGEIHARSFVAQLNRELMESFAREDTVRSELHGKLFTFSAGAHGVKQGDDLSALTRMADQKLYRAKHAGRDMVVFNVDTAKGKITIGSTIRSAQREA
jgi:diguanylate cyclase